MSSTQRLSVCSSLALFTAATSLTLQACEVGPVAQPGPTTTDSAPMESSGGGVNHGGDLDRRAPMLGATQARYHFFPAEQGYEAVTEVRGLHARISESGLVLSAPDDTSELPIRTTGVRCGASSLQIARSTLQTAEASGEQRSIDHQVGSHILSEWWRNGPRGIEQGFTLLDNPCEDEGDLAIEVELGEAALFSTEHGLEVHQPGMAALEYRDLYARDSAGTELAVRMEADGSVVSLHVDVAGAVWPVVIDPIVASPASLLTLGMNGTINGSASDRFGISADVDGALMVVGARSADVGANVDQGAAYVMRKQSSSGTHGLYRWEVLCKLTASDGQGLDWFGASVAQIPDGSGGATILVGAPATSATPARVGAAYIFRLDPTNLSCSQEAKLVPSGGAPGDRFGYAVAIGDGFLAIGAPTRDTSRGADSGAVYMFDKSGSSWVQTRTVESFATGGSPQLGFDVAISGSKIVAGAPYDDSPGIANHGSVQVFQRTSSGTYGSSVRLLAASTDRSAGDHLGYAVDVFGDYILGGAPDDNGANGAADQGAGYLFLRHSSGVWGLQQKIVAKLPAASDRFGFSVAFSDASYALIGAPNRDVVVGATTYTDQGSAFEFSRAGSVWTQLVELTESKVSGLGASGDRFGFAVAADPATLVVSAPYLDVPQTDQGAVAWFDAKTATATGKWESASEESYHFGRSVATADNWAIVGAHEGAFAFEHVGSAWVQRQRLTAAPVPGPGLFNRQPRIVMSGNTAVVVSGDAQVYVRGADGVWSLQATLPTTSFPSSPICAAVDEDTLALSFYQSTPAGSGNFMGTVVVYTRLDGVWTEQARVQNTDDRPYFGSSCALQNNTLAVGSIIFDTTPDNTKDDGQVYMFRRSGTTWAPDGVLKPPSVGYYGEHAFFGESLAVSSDTLVVGMPYLFGPTSARASKQEARVYTRNNGVWTLQQSMRGGTSYDSEFGRSVAITSTGLVAVMASKPGCVFLYERSTNWSTLASRLCVPAAFGASGSASSIALGGSTVLLGDAKAGPDSARGVVSAFDLTTTVP